MVANGSGQQAELDILFFFRIENELDFFFYHMGMLCVRLRLKSQLQYYTGISEFHNSDVHIQITRINWLIDAIIQNR